MSNAEILSACKPTDKMQRLDGRVADSLSHLTGGFYTEESDKLASAAEKRTQPSHETMRSHEAKQLYEARQSYEAKQPHDANECGSTITAIESVPKPQQTQDVCTIRSAITNGINAVGRELRLIGQGVIWGAAREGCDAITQHGGKTTLHLAETVGLAAALTAAIKAGPAPLRFLAAGAGAFFSYQTANWLRQDVFDAGRWKRIGIAVADTWHSHNNMERNLTIMQKDAGLLAFDAAVMVGGAHIGNRLGAVGLGSVAHVPVAHESVGGRALQLNAGLSGMEVAVPYREASECFKSKGTQVSRLGSDNFHETVSEAQTRDTARKDAIGRDLQDVRLDVAKQNAESQRPINPSSEPEKKALSIADNLDAIGHKASLKAKSALDTAYALVVEARGRLEGIEDATTAKKHAKLMLKQVSDDLQLIEAGRKTFAIEMERQKNRQDLADRKVKYQEMIQQAEQKITSIGSGQYFQAMKAIGRYAGCVEDCLACEGNPGKRDLFAQQAVKVLEELLDGLPNSRQGGSGARDMLSRRGQEGREYERISEIRQHVESRLNQMDNKHDARLTRILNLPAVKSAFQMVTSGQVSLELPNFIEGSLQTSRQRIANLPRPAKIAERTWENIKERVAGADVVALAADKMNLEAVLKESTIVFFDSNGRLIDKVGTDGRTRPKYFDVPAIRSGFGRGGAGVDRLLGENPVGFALIAPKVRMSFDWKMELHQIGTNSKQTPVYLKEVVLTGGKVPDLVTRGTAANRLSGIDKRASSSSKSSGDQGAVMEMKR